MGGSAKNFSSWRQDFITCEPGVTDFPFFDTKPNLIYIKNPNNTFINIGMKSIPTEKEYEFQIIANSYDAFGQPNGCGHLYIYNPSASNIIIECYSQYDEFSILILKNYSLALNKLSVEGEMTFKDGVQLPAGNHEIGAVRLNNQQLKSITDIMEAISNNTDKNEDVYTLLSNQLNGNIDGTLKNILNDIAGYFIGLLQNSPAAGNVNLYNIHYQIKTLAENLLSNAAVADKITLYDVITNLDKIYNKNNDFYNQFMSQISLSEPGNIKTLLGDIITAVNNINVQGGDGAWTAEQIASIIALLNDIIRGVNNINNAWTAEKSASIIAALSPMKEFFNTEKQKQSGVVYKNNATEIQAMATGNFTIWFDWLAYDGGTTATIKIGDTECLTLMSGEFLRDLTFIVPANTLFTIESTEPMYRAKYKTGV